MPREEHRFQARRKPSQVRAELTRDRILTAAAHIFTEFGYAAGTTNRIAERARVSIGSLYQYFPNKDAILAELLMDHIDEDGASDPIPDAASTDLGQVLRHFVGRTIDNHRADPRLLRIMIEEAPLSQNLIDKIIRYGEKRIAHLRHLLETHPEVRVTDLDTAARLIENTVELVVHKLMADPERVEAQRLENELVDMLSRYLRA